ALALDAQLLRELLLARLDPRLALALRRQDVLLRRRPRRARGDALARARAELRDEVPEERLEARGGLRVERSLLEGDPLHVRDRVGLEDPARLAEAKREIGERVVERACLRLGEHRRELLGRPLRLRVKDAGRQTAEDRDVGVRGGDVAALAQKARPEA